MKPTTVNSGTSVPVDSATALRPQIILTQYPEGQTPEAIIAKNCEKFNNTSSDQDIITDYDEQEEVYCIFGNTYIFPPKTSERFFGKAAEFKSKFITDFPRTHYNLKVIFPKEDKHRRAAENFCNSFKAGTKEIIEDEEIPNPKASYTAYRSKSRSKSCTRHCESNSENSVPLLFVSLPQI